MANAIAKALDTHSILLIEKELQGKLLDEKFEEDSKTEEDLIDKGKVGIEQLD